MDSKKFATAINCIDGKTQNSVSEWIKKQYSVDYVDMVTEPGCDRIMCETEQDAIDRIKSKVLISINAHKSSLVAVAGHHDCAGNPVSKEEHLSQIKKCIETVASWNLPIKTVGLWVNDKLGNRTGLNKIHCRNCDLLGRGNLI